MAKGIDYFLGGDQLALSDYFDEDGKWLPRLAYEGVADGVSTLDSNVQVEQPPNAASIANLSPIDAGSGEFLISKGGAVYKATGNAAGGPTILDANGKVASRLAYEGTAGGVATLDANSRVISRLAYEGVADGVATLNTDGIPLLASGIPVIETGGDDTNGRWIKYLGGILMQYGRTDYDTGSSNSKRVYYPIEFGYVMGVFLNRITSSSTPWHGTMTIVAVWPTDHFDFWAYIQGGSTGQLESSNANLKFSWLAIGTT